MEEKSEDNQNKVDTSKEETKPLQNIKENEEQPEQKGCHEKDNIECLNLTSLVSNVLVPRCPTSEEEPCNIKVEVNENNAISSELINQEVLDKYENEKSAICTGVENETVEELIKITSSDKGESHSGDESSSLDDDIEADSSLKMSPKPLDISSNKKNESLALISSLYDYSSDSGSDSRSLGDGFSEHRSVCFSSNSEQLCSDDTEESDSDLESIIAKKPTYVPKQVKVLGELSVKDLPPIEDLHISVKEEECIPFGKVYSIVDTLLVVQSLPDKPALNLDSVFFRHNGVPIGRIFDVFGPVKRPFYSVRFNTNEEIHGKGLAVDVVLYAAPETKHTQYVFAHQLMKEKGSDASWVNDCEPPPECVDYSDDEEERNNKRKQKPAKKPVVKQEEIEESSPARKKYLSFEERMNRNNVMRTKYYNKVYTSSFRRNKEVGWHNRIDRPPSTPSPQLASSNSINGSTGVFHMRPPLFIPPSSKTPLPPPIMRPSHLPPQKSSFITYNQPPQQSVPPHFNPHHPPPSPPVWRQNPQTVDDNRFPMNYPPVQPSPNIHNSRHGPPFQQLPNSQPPPTSDYFYRYQPPPIIPSGPPTIIRPQFSSPSSTSNNLFHQYSQFSRGGNSF